MVFLAGDVGAGEALPPGTRITLEDASVSARVLRSGRPLRVDDYENAGGPTGADGLRAGIRIRGGRADRRQRAPLGCDGRDLEAI